MLAAAICAKGDSGDDGWLQPAGGSWDNAANWSEGHVPFGDADFNLATGSPYVVTFGKQESIGGSVNVLNSSLILNAGSGDAINSSNLNINTSAGQTISFTFNGASIDGTDGSGINASTGSLLNSQYYGGVGGAGAVSFNFNNGMFTDDPNPFAFGAGSTTVFNNAKILATMAISGSVTVNASTGLVGNVSLTGSNANPALLIVTGGSNFSGNLFAVGNHDGTLTGPSSGYGVVDVNGVGTLLTTAYQIEIGSEGPFSNGGVGTGTLNVTGGGEVSSKQIYIGSIGGTGTVTVNGSGSLVSCGSTINIAGGSSMQVAGGGKITAALLNMSSGSTLAIGLDDGGISVSGLATLAGTLNVTLGTTPDPTAGETFDLLSFGSESGSFTTIDLPPLDPGLSWSTQNLYTNGSISVVAVPEPKALSAVAIAGIALLGRRRRLTV